MRINPLPTWAQMALANGPVFGSDNEGAPAAGAPAGAGTGTPPPDKPEADKPINISEEDHTKALRERDQAQQELAALQQKDQERTEADEQAAAATRTKEENQAKQIETLTEENGKLTLVNTENLLELAVLKNGKYDWANPVDIVKLIDRTGIKIDAKTGKVEGVDDALKKLAKDSAYLLKPANQNGEENPDNLSGAGTPVGQPSGGTPSGNGDASAKATKRAKMQDRFSVLRG